MKTAFLAAALFAIVACKRGGEPVPTAAPEGASGARPDPARPSLPPPAAVKSAEPDDDWQHAQPIPSRAIVSGEFAPTRGGVDDDWTKVTPGPGAKLSLRIFLTGVADAALEVFDRDRNRILRQRGPGDPLAARRVGCLEACFIKVSGGAGSYTLSVLGEPVDAAWELEPNDRAVDANALAAGAGISGWFGSGADQDWYRLAFPDAKPGQFLRVEISAVPGVRPELEVRALDGALLATLRGPAEGQPLFVRDLALPLEAPAAAAPDAGSIDAGDAGDAGAAPAPPPAGERGLFLVVRSSLIPGSGRAKAFRGANVKDAYTLSTALETGPADLEIEPNDEPQRATDLGPPLSRSGYLAPGGDVDWYRVKVERPSILHVEVSALERADLELSVHAPGKPGEKPKMLARANEGGVREGEVLPAVGIPAGESLIRVESAARNVDGRKWVRDTEDRNNLYKLTATVAPDDGTMEREPNGTPAAAQELALPASIKGYIWPRKDVDAFAFKIGEGHAPISVKVSAVRGVDLQLALKQKSGAGWETIGTGDTVKGEGEEQIVSVPVKPGDYVVEVSSPRHRDASATQAYVLTIQ